MPWFDGAILLTEWKDAIQDKSVAQSPQPRTLSERHANGRRLFRSMRRLHERLSAIAITKRGSGERLIVLDDARSNLTGVC